MLHTYLSVTKRKTKGFFFSFRSKNELNNQHEKSTFPLHLWGIQIWCYWVNCIKFFDEHAKSKFSSLPKHDKYCTKSVQKNWKFLPLLKWIFKKNIAENLQKKMQMFYVKVLKIFSGRNEWEYDHDKSAFLQPNLQQIQRKTDSFSEPVIFTNKKLKRKTNLKLLY